MKSWGIKRRVLFLALVPAAAIAIVLAFFFTFNHVDDLERSLIERGTAIARHLAPAVEYGVISGNRQALETLLAVAADEPDVTALTIRDAEGQILASRGSAASHAGHQITAPESRVSLEQDGMVLVFTAPVLLRAAVPADLRASEPPEEKVVGRVYVELSKASLIAKKNRLLTERLAVTLLGLAGAAMLALRMGQDVTRPISKLAGTVQELGRGNLEARVVPNSGGELLVLQKGVNSMAAALQEGRETLERRIAQATQALAEKKEEAERANAAKSRFLAAASHDLRQPMHALHLFVGEMRARAHAPETRQIVGRIESSVAAMEEMLDALLDISKLDAGALEPQVSVFAVTHLLERMRESFAPAAREQGLRLRIAPCKLHIRSDPLLLERILLNLVSNALRYTPRGKILVGCRRRGASVRIEVRDSGIGIPEQELRNIFQEFYQLSGADRDRAKGLGLGLAIVERLARLLGHELHVASTPGKGSLFAVEVPRAQASVERPPVRAAAPSAASWMLIVDDDPLAREAMARLLTSWNWEVLCAGSRSEALARIAGRDEPPAAIICDFHLSETEKGIELIERVREHFSFGVPGILVSGDSSPRTLKQARACGCPLLLKPLRPAKLRALLAHLLSERAAHG